MASAFYPFSAILLNNGGGGITYTGPAYSVSGGRVDENDAMKALFKVTQVNVGTVDAEIQGSWDGENWIPVVSMTQLVAAGAGAELQAFTKAAPFLRVKITPAGGATFTAAHIEVVSTRGILVALVPT